MAENITVDELAIKLSANADAASTSLKNLAATVEAVAVKLAPLEKTLQTVTNMLRASKGSEKALTQALKTSGKAAKDTADDTEAAARRIERAYAKVAKAQALFSKAQGLAAAGGPIDYSKRLNALSGASNRALTDLIKVNQGESAIPSSDIAALSGINDKQLLTAEAYAKSIGKVQTEVGQASIKLNKFTTAFDAFKRQVGTGIDPLSPNFDEQLAVAKGHLSTMRSALKQINEAELADTQAMQQYTTAVSVANAKLKQLAATHKLIGKYSTIASMNGSFTPAPFVAPNLTGKSKSTVVPPATTEIPAASTATAKRIWSVGSAVDKLKAKFAGVETTGTKAVKNVGMSFVQLRSWVFFAMFAIAGLTATFGVFIKGAMAYFEQMHLFGTVFGDIAGDVNSYADAITGALGIDPVAFKRTAATFYEMARAMNISTAAARTMSENFTQLTYDYASLFDMDFETVFEKFRSAMAGQTRSIHQFGLDVTIAALQEEAYKEGIRASVTEMSKANKAILMHNAIMRNSTRAQGDLARTITQPANMLRIMKDQFTVLARTIGFLFMPALQAILPWLITLAQVLNKAAQGFLALFGIKMPDWSAFTAGAAAAGDGTDDLFNDAVDGAKAAKDALKDYTMGFDELHIINPATASGSGADSSAGGGATIKPFDVYDMLGGINALAKIVDPIIEKFKVLGGVFAPFIDALKKLWDAFKPFAKNVWDGFKSFYADVLGPLGVWTMNEDGVWLVERLTKALDWFNQNPAAAKTIGKILGAFLALKGLDAVLGILSGISGIFLKMFGLKNIISIFKGLGDILLNIAGVFTKLPSIIGAIASAFAVGGASEGFAALSAALGPGGWLVLGIAAVVAAGVLIYKNWDTIKAKAKELWNAIKPIRDLFSELSKQFMENMKPALDAIREAWATWKPIIADLWKSLKESLSPILSVVWDQIKNQLVVALYAVVTAISVILAGLPGFIKAWAGAATAVGGAFNVIQGAIHGDLEQVKKGFQQLESGISQVGSGVSASLDAMKVAVGKSTDAVAKTLANFTNNVYTQIDKIRSAAQLNLSINVQDAQHRTSGIQRYAVGGMPSLGSIFQAGEAGPELLGSYGGNPNTVMPLAESGFVEAMAAATFSAVVQGLKTAGGSGGSGDVYLDGVKVGKVIRTTETRAGVTNGMISVRA